MTLTGNVQVYFQNIARGQPYMYQARLHLQWQNPGLKTKPEFKNQPNLGLSSSQT